MNKLKECTEKMFEDKSILMKMVMNIGMWKNLQIAFDYKNGKSL